MDAFGEPDLSRVLVIVRRWWLVLLAAAAVGGAVAQIVAGRNLTYFVAKADVLVGPMEGPSNSLRAAGSQAQTLAYMAASPSVLQAAQRRAGAASEGNLSRLRVQATANETTRILTVWASAQDPRNAAIIANAVASELSRTSAAGHTVVVDAAHPPSEPMSTGLKYLHAILMLGSLLLVLIVLLVHDYFRGRVEREDDLQSLTGAPHIATIRRLRRGSPSTFDVDPGADIRDAFGLVAGRLAFAAPQHQFRSVVLTTAQPGDSSAEVAIRLATVLAAQGSRVVLLEADADAAEVTDLLSLAARAGLGELLASRGQRPSIPELAVDVAPRLRVVPVGKREHHDSLAGPVASRILGRILENADVVIVSAGSASTSAVALAWSSCAEATILVARRGKTRRDALGRAAAAIADVGGTLMGSVLDGSSRGLLRRTARRPSGGAAAVSRPPARLTPTGSAHGAQRASARHERIGSRG